MKKLRFVSMLKITSTLYSRALILLSLSIFSSSTNAACTFGNVSGGIFNWNAEITVTNDGTTDVVGWDVTWTFDINSTSWAVFNVNYLGGFFPTTNSSPTFTSTAVENNSPAAYTVSPGETIVLSVQGGGGVGLPSVSTPLTGALCGAAATIIATDDVAATPIDGTIGGTITENVLTNDILNGMSPINALDVNLVPVISGPLTVNADGSVDVASGTSAGTYTVTYEICEAVLPSNCDTAEVSVDVFEPVVVVPICGNATEVYIDDFGTGGPSASSEVVNHGFVTGTPFDGFYHINDPANETVAFFGGGNLLDHTVGDVGGSALVINMLNAPTNFYENTVTGITPNADVTFLAWVNGTCPGCPDLGELELIVEDTNGNVIANSVTSIVPNDQTWYERSFTFNPGANTSLNFILRNASASGSNGNDLLIDDIALCQEIADLTLLKVVNSTIGGGTALAEDWTLEANAGGGIAEVSGVSGVTETVGAGDYVLSELNGPDGYIQTDLSCDAGVLDTVSSTLTLSSNEDVICTFTNRDLITDLQVIKSFVPANPEINDVVTFTLTVTNSGPDAASNIVVDDVIQSGFAFVANSMMGGDSQNQTAPNLQWVINNLPAGAANAVSLTYQAVVN